MLSTANASRGRGRGGRHGAGAALALAAVLALAGVRTARAQDAGPAVVAKVAVEADGKPAEKGLLDLIPIQVGDPYSPRLVDQAVKQIFRTGLFADVRVLKSGEDRVELVFVLVRNLFINNVFFRGSGDSSARLREGLVSLRPGTILQEDKVPAAVAEVREGLRKGGYFGASVECDVRRKAGDSTVNLVFRASGWKSYRIGSLELEWKADISETDLFKKMKSKIGQAYVPNVLEADLEALAAALGKSGYRRAEVRLAGEAFDEAKSLVDLRIEILPHEKIMIAVNGAKVPTRLLEPIWEERVFEQWGLAEGEVRVLNHLRRKGYLFATVKSRVEKRPDEIRIIHDVAPGAKFKIESVGFQGLASFSELDMKTRLAISEGVPFFALLSYDRLFSIPREVEAFYKENGFADVQVRLDLVKQKTGVRAVFDVREGLKTTVETIRFEGGSLFPAEALLRELVSRAGGPYFPPNIQRDVGQIESFYLNRGVRGTAVVARVEPVAENRVSFVYEIQEGEKVTVRDIFITGNRSTKNRVIGKELRIGKGDEADYAKVQETKRRLERLGIFSEVRVEEVPTGTRDEVVVVTVREGEKNYAGVGLGFESLTPLSGSLASWPNDFRPRGTAEYIRTNVFGLGAQVGLLGQLSTVERRAVASWNQPYLFGLNLPGTLLAWAEREERESFTYDRRGISLSTVRSLGKARLLLASLSLVRTALPKVDLENPPSDIDRRFLPYSAALVSVSMNWERRDDTLNPERGLFFSAVGEWGFPVFGMESDYQKVFLKSQFFRPLPAGLNLGVTARLGLGNGLRNLPERFFAGGSNTFRGEEFDMLGPIEPTTLKPLGGEAVFLVNSELVFAVIPSWKELRLAAFFDLGNVYASLKTFRPFELQGAAGAGIRYRTPLGPVRVEVAWKLWGLDAQDKKGKPLIFLTIGNIF
jgi:outer membrane protein assembly complex protein YaeT